MYIGCLTNFSSVQKVNRCSEDFVSRELAGICRTFVRKQAMLTVMLSYRPLESKFVSIVEDMENYQTTSGSSDSSQRGGSFCGRL